MCRPTTCRQCGKTTWAGCGMHVEQVLAGVPRAVLARAGAVLEALEARARGLDPLSDELPLFARPAAAAPQGPDPAAPHPALAALVALDPDALSPREAQEALYRLCAMLEEGAVPGAVPALGCSK